MTTQITRNPLYIGYANVTYNIPESGSLSITSQGYSETSSPLVGIDGYEYYGGNITVRRPTFKFDLTNLNASDIQEAKIVFNGSNVVPSGKSFSVNLYRLLSDATNKNWQSYSFGQPNSTSGYDTTLLGSATIPNSNRSIIVTNIIKDIINGVYSNLGFVLKHSNEWNYVTNNDAAEYQPYATISSVQLIITLTPPNAPSNFTITHTKSTSVDCSWTDNSNNETGFKIYNRLGSTPNPSTDTLIKSLDVGITSTTISDLTEGQTYNLYVVSYNNNGNSSASNIVTVTTSANLSRNLSINYDILSPIQKSIDFNYDIRNQVSRELEIVYNLNKEPVENSLSIKYDIYGNEKFKLGLYKVGTKSLGEVINTSFFDLTETIDLTRDPQGAVYNLTEGIVIYRGSTRNLTEYFNAIYKSSLYNITETLTIRNFSEYDLSESILIKGENNYNLTETLNIVFTGSQDLTENINIYLDGKLDLTEDLTVRGQGTFNLTESININLNEGFNLTETINIYKLGLRNLDETLTIIAERKYNLTEIANVVYSGKRDLTETINIVSYHFNLPETLTVKSLGIDGIILYLDAQHTQPVDNNIDSFIYDFGTQREEEKIIAFYIQNSKAIPLTNIQVGINSDDIYNLYKDHMVTLSTNGIDFTKSDITIGTLNPSATSVFYIRLKPKYGIDEKQFNTSFRIYTR